MAQSVAVVGCGLIGRSWAASFARGGWQVRLFDQDRAAAEAALEFAARVAGELEAVGLCGGRTAAAMRAAVAVAGSLAEALAGAGHVQESTPEQVELKTQVFGEPDALAPPEAVIASSASALLPSEFTQALAGRARTPMRWPDARTWPTQANP